MKMGTIASPWRYEAGVYVTARQLKLQPPVIRRYGSIISGATTEGIQGSVTARSAGYCEMRPEPRMRGCATMAAAPQKAVQFSALGLFSYGPRAAFISERVSKLMLHEE
jgi:hypothetical protein